MRDIRRMAVFSLVELLVVIGIIALLAALLLPALQQAKKMALSSQCQGNLRQCGIALTGYANDFGDWAIGADSDTTPVAEMMMAYGYAPRAGSYIASWGCSKVPNGQAYQCPALPPQPGAKVWGTTFPSGGYSGVSSWSYGLRCYSWNRWYYSGEKLGGDGKFMRLSSVYQPSRLPYMADTSVQDNSGAANMVQHYIWYTWANPANCNYGGSLHLRHNKRGNVWMPDGHAASWALADTWEFKCASPGVTGQNDPIGYNY